MINGVPCPNCGGFGSDTIAVGPSENAIRRRRVCRKCKFRYNTMETVAGVLPAGLHRRLSTVVAELTQFLKDEAAS